MSRIVRRHAQRPGMPHATPFAWPMGTHREVRMPLHVAAALPQPVRDLIAEGGNTLPGDDALVAGAPGFGRAAPRVNPDWRG